MATNLKYTAKDSKLIIEVDMSQRNGETGSGKNIMVASAGTDKAIPGFPNAGISCTIYTKKGT